MARKYTGEWKLICSECKVERYFSSYNSFLNAKRLDTTLCVSCCQKGKGHPHTEQHKKYMRKLMTGRNVTWGDKIREGHWARTPEKKQQIIERHSSHMADLFANGGVNHKSNKGFQVGYYFNKSTGTDEYYRSSYELCRMKELNDDMNVIKWTTRHGLKFAYDYAGKTCHYIPDFLIEYKTGKCIVEEVKGWINDEEKHLLKIKSATENCAKLGYEYKVNFMRK